MTNREAIRLVREAEREYNGRNVTRWYTTVHPRRNREAVVKTWAVKTWKGKPLIMLASAYNTDGRTKNMISGRCMIHHFTNSPAFNWLDYGGRTHQAVWSNIDEGRDGWYEANDHIFGCYVEHFGLGTWLNSFDGTKYQYSAYERSGMRVSDYIDLCRMSPKTELLTKASLFRWLTPTFVNRLENDAGLMRFVSRNRKELVGISPSVVCDAIRRFGYDVPVRKVKNYDALRSFGLSTLPISSERVFAWSKRNGVSLEKLRHHVDNLKELGLSLKYEPHVLPHDWATYSLEIEDRVEKARELAIKKKRKMVYEARKEAREYISRLYAEGKIRINFKIVLPTSAKEMRREGDAMHNCIGGYWNSVQAGVKDVVFIRKNGRPYIDMEVDNGKIVQKRYHHNRDVQKGEDLELCKLIAEAFKKKAA